MKSHFIGLYQVPLPHYSNIWIILNCIQWVKRWIWWQSTVKEWWMWHHKSIPFGPVQWPCYCHFTSCGAIWDLHLWLDLSFWSCSSLSIQLSQTEWKSTKRKTWRTRICESRCNKLLFFEGKGMWFSFLMLSFKFC